MKIDELGDRWPKVYRYLLERYQIIDAARIARYYRPKKIYKYYSFNSLYWKKNLYNGEICFNSPSRFNDQLDSRWFIDYDKLLSARFETIGENWRESDLRQSGYLDIAIPTYEEELYCLRDLFRISCFSETPYSHVMWGHYADKHRGFCLEYDTSCLKEEMNLLMPVVYTDKPYDATPILDMDDPYAALIPTLFKSKDWSYECEWRICIKDKNKEDRRILSSVDAITGVYLGLYSTIPVEELTKLEMWVKEHNITLQQMQRSYLSYDLVSNTLEDIRLGKKTNGLLI